MPPAFGRSQPTKIFSHCGKTPTPSALPSREIVSNSATGTQRRGGK
jgi:hypothetical protein